MGDLASRILFGILGVVLSAYGVAGLWARWRAGTSHPAPLVFFSVALLAGLWLVVSVLRGEDGGGGHDRSS